MLAEVERTKITEERLGDYRRRLYEHFATPVFCLGVGLGDDRLVFCWEDTVAVELPAWLRAATTMLAKRFRKKRRRHAP